jgi:hypothetical protein
MPPQMQRTRTLVAVAVVVLLSALAAIAALVVHITTGSSALPASSVPGVLQTPAGGPCLDSTQARAVWTDVNARIDALSLHPDISHVAAVAEGTAADDIRQYLQQTLIDKHLTEREREHLDDLTVVQPGCSGQPLTVHVHETVVQDDYLRPDGHVDHTDPAVGQTLNMLESYVRSGGTWKIIALTSLDQPTPSGNFV